MTYKLSERLDRGLEPIASDRALAQQDAGSLCNTSMVLLMKPLPDDCWNAWSPDELLARLGHWRSEWYVAGGWALDLWHGHQARAHEDLEFAVLPADIDGCRKILSELDFFEAREGKLSYLAPNAVPPEDLW